MTADFNEEITNQLKPIRADAQAMNEVQSNIALQGLAQPKTKTNGQTDAPTTDDVAMAVRDIADMAEKTMIQFVALGELARAVRDNSDVIMSDHLEIGFPINQLTAEIKSLFNTWHFEETPYGYLYYFTPPIKWSVHIPVQIHVFKRSYAFFKNPDRGFFGVDDFNIPNPFEKYWKARFLIK